MKRTMTRREAVRRIFGGAAAAAVAALAVSCSGPGDAKPKPKPKPSAGTQPAAPEPNADMRKYVCGKCGYVYDPAGASPPKSFQDLPDDWKCPRCGSPKSRFSPKS